MLHCQVYSLFKCWYSGDSNQKGEANRPEPFLLVYEVYTFGFFCATGRTVSLPKLCFTLLGLKGSKMRGWGHPKVTQARTVLEHLQPSWAGAGLSTKDSTYDTWGRSVWICCSNLHSTWLIKIEMGLPEAEVTVRTFFSGSNPSKQSCNWMLPVQEQTAACSCHRFSLNRPPWPLCWGLRNGFVLWAFQSSERKGYKVHT